MAAEERRKRDRVVEKAVGAEWIWIVEEKRVEE